MSKSKGNVVSPFNLIDTYDADVLRYYMIKEGGVERDGDWNNESLQNRYIYLSNTWGNLVQRMMGSIMNLEVAVQGVFSKPEFKDGRPYHGRRVYTGVPSLNPKADDEVVMKTNEAIKQYKHAMMKPDLKAALDSIDELWRTVSSSRELSNGREIDMPQLLNRGISLPMDTSPCFIPFNIGSVK